MKQNPIDERIKLTDLGLVPSAKEGRKVGEDIRNKGSG